MKNKLTKLAAAGALTLSATAAFAGETTQPGITIGGSAAPLPPGLYFSDTFDWGVRNSNVPLTAGTKTAVGVNASVLAWSTPWQLLGARLIFAAALPEVEVGVTGFGNGTYAEGVFNPFFGATLAWNLGNGFAASYTVGGYPKLKSPVAQDANEFEQRFALSYLANGWNLTANLIYGINDPHFTSPAVQLTTQGPGTPDFINLDVTAAKTFGKWEIGAVGFYTTDLSDRIGNAFGPRQKELALGALLGYNFGPVILQTYFTRDVWQEGLGGFDTRIWSRVIIPLGDPFAPAPSLMYHK